MLSLWCQIITLGGSVTLTAEVYMSFAPLSAYGLLIHCMVEVPYVLGSNGYASNR